MGVVRKLFAIHDLRVGMFVSELDRPWHTTPFPLQGFYIRNEDQLRSLANFCKHVYVDVAEKRAPDETPSTANATTNRKPRRPGQRELVLPPLRIRDPHVYVSSTPVRKEIRKAEHLLKDVHQALARFEERSRRGEAPDVRETEQVAGEMVASVLRNPDALVWLGRVRRQDSHSYQHALNMAVWALVLGRQLGLAPDVLHHLCSGCLLSQVGKALLPPDVLKSESGMDADVQVHYRQYVQLGAEALEQSGVSAQVVAVVRYHRERHNGSGFPQGVSGDQIPLLGRIAGLVDHYESLIDARDEHERLTAAQAVARLYEYRNMEFQADLVELFIQAIGVYPTATLVELSNHQKGLVLSHKSNRRLWPEVMIMIDEHGQMLRSGRIIDLAEHNEQRASSERLNIVASLPRHHLPEDLSFFDLVQGSGRWSWRSLLGG